MLGARVWAWHSCVLSMRVFVCQARACRLGAVRAACPESARQSVPRALRSTRCAPAECRALRVAPARAPKQRMLGTGGAGVCRGG
eukprot:7669622-Alexandrium_andersonii.AAC.1